MRCEQPKMRQRKRFEPPGAVLLPRQLSFSGVPLSQSLNIGTIQLHTLGMFNSSPKVALVCRWELWEGSFLATSATLNSILSFLVLLKRLFSMTRGTRTIRTADPLLRNSSNLMRPCIHNFLEPKVGQHQAFLSILKRLGRCQYYVTRS